MQSSDVGKTFSDAGKTLRFIVRLETPVSYSMIFHGVRFLSRRLTNDSLGYRLRGRAIVITMEQNKAWDYGEILKGIIWNEWHDIAQHLPKEGEGLHFAFGLDGPKNKLRFTLGEFRAGTPVARNHATVSRNS